MKHIRLNAALYWQKLTCLKVTSSNPDNFKVLFWGTSRSWMSGELYVGQDKLTLRDSISVMVSTLGQEKFSVWSLSSINNVLLHSTLCLSNSKEWIKKKHAPYWIIISKTQKRETSVWNHSPVILLNTRFELKSFQKWKMHLEAYEYINKLWKMIEQENWALGFFMLF